jgi:Cytochrome P450
MQGGLWTCQNFIPYSKERLALQVGGEYFLEMDLMQDMQALFSPETLPIPHIACAAARAPGNLIPIPEWQTVMAFCLDEVNAFVSGPHYCLGAPLARLEMQVFLECLLAKYPDFHVPEQSNEYRPNYAVRGLVRLEVELEGKR